MTTIAHDERVRWAASSDGELVRSSMMRTVGLGAVVLAVVGPRASRHLVPDLVEKLERLRTLRGE